MYQPTTKGTTMKWTSPSGKLELDISRHHAILFYFEVEHIGNDPLMIRQRKKMNRWLLIDELKSTGLWSEDRLTDHNSNFAMLVWLAGCDIYNEVKPVAK
jgi:hypothetical protein